LTVPFFTLPWGDRGTQVYVGAGLLRDQRFWDTLLPPNAELAIVADAGVCEHWLALLVEEGLSGRPLLTAVLPSGEETKSRKYKEALEDLWLSFPLTRQGVALALGGGVIGDLVGYTAGTYLRGIPHIQIPTTLLAMVDSSLGGKTAVDHPLGKNLIGLFHPARAIVADIETLSTLPDRLFRHGIVEGIKHAIIRDREFFRWIEKKINLLLKRDKDTLLYFVEKNLRIKGEVVQEDPYETDMRQILNFGHTVGHALEQVTGYTLPHAEAVAIGILCELKLAENLRGFPGEESRRIERLLARLELFPSSSFLKSLDREAILQAMERDKKVRKGQIRFSLPRRIGEYPPNPPWGYAVPAGREEISRALGWLRAWKSSSE